MIKTLIIFKISTQVMLFLNTVLTAQFRGLKYVRDKLEVSQIHKIRDRSRKDQNYISNTVTSLMVISKANVVP
jgi:hypothetical protein